MIKRRIALDLDGVFADWEGFMQETFGESYSNKVWAKLDKIENMFFKLKVLPGSKKMFDHIWDLRHKEIYNIFILTALPRPTGMLDTAADDKKEWVAKHLSPDIKVHTIIGGKNKKVWVHQKGDILIDDNERNINGWKDAGGTGILHTGDTKETLIKLTKALA